MEKIFVVVGGVFMIPFPSLYGYDFYEHLHAPPHVTFNIKATSEWKSLENADETKRHIHKSYAKWCWNTFFHTKNDVRNSWRVGQIEGRSRVTQRFVCFNSSSFKKVQSLTSLQFYIVLCRQPTYIYIYLSQKQRIKICQPVVDFAVLTHWVCTWFWELRDVFVLLCKSFRNANAVAGLNLNFSKGLQNKFHLFSYTIHVRLRSIKKQGWMIILTPVLLKHHKLDAMKVCKTHKEFMKKSKNSTGNTQNSIPERFEQIKFHTLWAENFICQREVEVKWKCAYAVKSPTDATVSISDEGKLQGFRKDLRTFAN